MQYVGFQHTVRPAPSEETELAETSLLQRDRMNLQRVMTDN